MLSEIGPKSHLTQPNLNIKTVVEFARWRRIPSMTTALFGHGLLLEAQELSVPGEGLPLGRAAIQQARIPTWQSIQWNELQLSLHLV